MTSVLNLEPETRVNTTTANSQSDPAIATLSDGSYVVTWDSFSQDGSGYGIYCQHFAADGSRIGGEVRVNTTTNNTQAAPTIAATDDGGFVIAWYGEGTVGGVTDSVGIFAQRFNSAGAALGGETLVNSTTAENQLAPSVSALIGGGFVVSWQSYNQDAAGATGVYSRIFNAGGSPSTGEIAVNTTTASDQDNPKTTTLANGDYIVTWESYNQDSSNTYGIYARQFAANGTPRGSEYRVNTTITGSQELPSIAALADGGYIIAWDGVGAGDTQGIFTQRYDAFNHAVGGETLAVPGFYATSYDQYYANVAGLADGGYIVSWTSLSQDGDSFGIFAQRFDDEGHAIGDEVQLNAYTTGDQYRSIISAVGDGGYVSAWTSLSEDGSGYGVYSRTYEATTSTSGTQYLYGTSDSDVLDGGSGGDWMYGGVGDDVYIVNSTSDRVIENSGEGTDEVQSSVSWTLIGEVENLTLTGSAPINGTGNNLNNIITGNNGANTLLANGGDDYVDAKGGNDYINGDTGNDTLLGGDGNDQIVGGDDNDYIDGGAGNDGLDGGDSDDQVYGGTGNDTIYTGAGANHAYGGDGDDLIHGEGGIQNYLDGGSGDDTITGSGQNDQIYGGDGHDVLTTGDPNGDGSAVMDGGAGNDLLFGGGGSDTLSGGDGDDNIEGGLGTNYISGGDGNDTVQAGGGVDVIDGGSGYDTYDASTHADTGLTINLQGGRAMDGATIVAYLMNVEWVIGSLQGDTITGDAGNNILYGYSGDDTLDGGAGDDKLMGMDGGDTASYASATAAVTVSLALQDNWQDTVAAGLDYLDSIANLTGSKYNDTLTGDNGNNLLDGGAGADVMKGGLGDDTYVVGNSFDNVGERLNEGTDTVLSSITYTLPSNVENLTLTGTDNLNATGNSDNNTLNGNAGNNLLDGGAGADKMYGGVGNDTYVVNNGFDQANENLNEGIDTVQSSITFTIGNNVENLTLTGTANINATGNALANILAGNSGNNVLKGGAGNDTFVFGKFGAANGLDHLNDFVNGADHLSFTGADYGIAAGHVLTAAELSATGAATSAAGVGQFVYNATTHTLSWDANGVTAGGMTDIVVFDNGATPATGDFLFT